MKTHLENERGARRENIRASVLRSEDVVSSSK